MARLYTFFFSHFSEKARWALDYSGVSFEEKRLLPGPHMLTTRRLAGGTTVPILVDRKVTIQGSSAIIDYLDETRPGSGLTPTDPVKRERSRAIEALADNAFGLGVQRIAYATMLEDRARLIDFWTTGGPWYGRPLYKLILPQLVVGLKRAYKVAPEPVARAKDRFRAAMDETDRELSDKPFLVGDKPCRADITVAALLAPFCRPKEHEVDYPTSPEGSDADRFLRELGGRPTWDFVHRMYREHRAVTA